MVLEFVRLMLEISARPLTLTLAAYVVLGEGAERGPMGNRLCACFGGGGQSPDARLRARKACAAGATDDPGGAACAAGATAAQVAARLDSIVQHAGDEVRVRASRVQNKPLPARPRALPARAHSEPHRPVSAERGTERRGSARTGKQWVSCRRGLCELTLVHRTLGICQWQGRCK